MHHLFLALLLAALTACKPDPRQLLDQARQSLDEGYAYLESDDDALALEAFKNAEHYGLLAGDSLTTSRARYQIGDMLYRKGETKDEYIGRLKAADEGFGTHYDERAKLWNLMGSAYTAFHEFDSAEMCMNQGLDYAEKSQSEEVYLTVLTNFFVLNFDRGNYGKATEYLWKFKAMTGLKTESDRLYYYQSLGTVYDAAGNTDSAAYFLKEYEDILQSKDDKEYKPYWDYLLLEEYAELRGDSAMALRYYEQFIKENTRESVREEKENLYNIQRQYDYEVLRNELNQKIIHKQRVIILVGGLAALVMAAFLVSQVRLARKRKQEAEINAELFHFKQQNKDLLQKDAEHEQIQQDYAARLSNALTKEQRIMLLLDNYLNSNKKSNLLKDLETSVYGDQDHWEAMLDVVNQLYPDLVATLQQKHPDLDEDERKSYILSFFKLSRQEEADYLGTTVNMVDKLRGRRRRKMEE